AKVCSIHVNGWFGEWDKLSMRRVLFAGRFDADLDGLRDSADFAGDCLTDAPMFGYFPHSVCVAYLRPFLDRVVSPPAYVTPSEGGAGFVELADALIDVKN